MSKGDGMIVRIVLLLVLLFVPLAGAAQEEPRTYVIQKGDTLWGISERFIQDPWYWPSLWAHNPDIRNPHFIYPGQTVRFHNGRLEIVPESTAPSVEEPKAVRTPAEPDAKPIIVKAIGHGPEAFVTDQELDTAGRIVDGIENRIMMGTGDRVFVDMRRLAEARPGDRFTLVSVGRPVSHPVSGQRVGYLVTRLGALQITETHPQVASGVITSSQKEIERGALLLPWEPPLREIALKQASYPLQGVILGGGQGQLAFAQFDHVFLDIGQADGLEVGNILHMSRSRKATDFGLQRADLQLPDILLGTAVVVDVKRNTATALILKTANLPIQSGDRVTAATE